MFGWKPSCVRYVGVTLALAIAGCSFHSSPGEESTGEDFESVGNAGSAPSMSVDAGVASAADAGTASDSGDRSVEEADLYRFVGDRLYVLNQYRGLYVFDVSDVDHPREIGRMPLVGYPVEMYVRGTRAYAIISDYFDYWRDDTAIGAGLTPSYGSRIVGIDLSDPTAPHEIGDVVLNGYVSDTRLVGDVLYAVANRYSYWRGYGTESSEARDEMVLTSIDIHDVTHIQEVQHLTFEGSGYYVHATSNAFVIASVNYDSPDGWARTHIRYVDISSPIGLLAARGEVAVDGTMQDDTALDVTDSQIRVLTRSWDDQTTKLRILDATEPDTLPVLGELDYFYVGSVFGTTFDGDRLYMVHFERIDPLEVVDLSDPTHPFVAGELEMPGWVERIAPLGDRLIGLGVDNTGSRAITVSLFDVSNPAAPALLDRVDSGSGEWAWSLASYERKAWTVDQENGMILFPYTSYDSGTYRQRNALGILEFDREHLSVRGEVEAAAPVERGALHEERVYALSQAALQVVDIRDREHPVPTATVELARSVSDYARSETVGVELVQPGISWGWWGGGDASALRVTALNAPDGDAEYSRIALPRTADALFVDGTTVVALRANAGYGYYDGYGPSSSSVPGVTFVSVADATAPTILADVDLPLDDVAVPSYGDYGSVSHYTNYVSRYNAPYGSWEGGDRALSLGHGRFALIRTTSTYCSGLETCREAGIEPVVSTYYTRDASGELPYYAYWGSAYHNALVILDAATHTVSAPIDLGDGSIENAFVRDGLLVYSHAVPSRIDERGRSYVRYYMERYSIESDGALTHIDSINVPGVVISLAEDGSHAITIDHTYGTGPDADEWYPTVSTLNTVTFEAGRAHRAARIDLEGSYNGVVARGDVVYVTSSPESYWYYGSPSGGAATDSRYQGALSTIDMRVLDAPRVATRTELGFNAYWSLAALTDGALALRGGYSTGLAVFDLRDDALSPTFRRFARTNGYGVSITQDGDTLYLCGGPYGIQTVSLAATP